MARQLSQGTALSEKLRADLAASGKKNSESRMELNSEKNLTVT
jgi:hypothetical protein